MAKIEKMSFSVFLFWGSEEKQFQFSTVVLSNLSLGYNYHNTFPCGTSNRFKFTPNRKKPKDDSIKIIYNLMNFYPTSITESNTIRIANLLEYISRKPKFPKIDEVYFIFTVNVSILNHLLNTTQFALSNCTSADFLYCQQIQNMDYHYHFMRFFNPKLSLRELPVIYSNLQQTLFETAFLKSHHYTEIKHFPFTGYYASAFALLVHLPFYLRIYDFFDYSGRIDIDFNNFSVSDQIAIHPYKKLFDSSIYLHGCYYKIDAYFVATNIFKCIFEFSMKISSLCQKSFYSPNFFPNSFFSKENLAIPGAYQICWLGLYSSIEVKIFNKHFINFPGGWRQNRWGDQQYFLLVLALFSTQNHSSITRNCQFCFHQQLR